MSREYVRQRLAEFEREQPEYTDWWFSGRYWYVTVTSNGQRATGAGVTKDDARADGILELRRRKKPRMATEYREALERRR